MQYTTHKITETITIFPALDRLQSMFPHHVIVAMSNQPMKKALQNLRHWSTFTQQGAKNPGFKPDLLPPKAFVCPLSQTAKPKTVISNNPDCSNLGDGA